MGTFLARARGVWRAATPKNDRAPERPQSRAPLALVDSRAERLHRLAAALSRAASPADVATAFLDQALEHLGADGGTLVLEDATGSALELVAGRDLPGAKARLLERVPLDQDFSVTVAFRTGRPAMACTFGEIQAKFPTSAQTFGSAGAQAVYALPLVVGGETAGAFSVFFAREHQVSEADAEFLDTMAQLCGQALERSLLADAESRARERAEEAARYATSLYSLGMRLAGALTPTDVATTVMREAIAQHGAAAAAVGLIDQEHGEVELLVDDDYPQRALEVLRRFPLDAPFPAAAAARSSKPVFVGTLAERRSRFPRLPSMLGDGSVAIAALPLIAAGRTFGVLILRYANDRAFESDERRFLLTLADDCSQALDRARLHAETERQAQRARFLLQIANSLGLTSSYQERMHLLLDALVPAYVQFASIEELDRQGVSSSIAEQSGADASGERAAALRPAAMEMIERVVASGTPECLEVTSDSPAGRETGCCVGVSLTVADRFRGALLAITVRDESETSRPDVELIAELGRVAVLALENARLYEREHHIAHTLQESLRPLALPRAAGLEFAAVFVPAGDGNEVGGDFYDVFRKGDGYTAIVGDVCGKGPEAAKLTALCRHTLRAAAVLDDAGPSRSLALLNRAILDQVPATEFCTVLAVDIVRTGEGTLRSTISSAGHPPAIVARHGGSVEVLEIKGTVLGVREDPRLEDLDIELDAGDTLIFVTDGIEEARRDDGEFYGRERLHASVRRAMDSGRSTADALVAAIRDDLDGFCGDRDLRDDIVILAIRCAASDAPAL
ncbi:MAG: hypothetical protein QOI71_192 [Gaiellales bacterium]|nr:hypothetical protein [Gaiellales bacterium]